MKKQNKAIFYEIKSRSVKGKKHIVRLMPDKTFACDCWPYLRKGSCWHIEQIKTKYCA